MASKQRLKLKRSADDADDTSNPSELAPAIVPAGETKDITMPPKKKKKANKARQHASSAPANIAACAAAVRSPASSSSTAAAAAAAAVAHGDDRALLPPAALPPVAPPSPFIRVAQALSTEEARHWAAWLETRARPSPSVHFGASQKAGARCGVAWLSVPGTAAVAGEVPCPPALLSKLAACVDAGAAAWGLGVNRVSAFEPVQFAQYEAGDHYRKWHVDSPDHGARVASGNGGRTGERDRVLSVVVLLTAADTGGEFEVRDPRAGVVRPKFRPGDALVFSARTLWHRVAPILQGRRASLVLWASPAPLPGKNGSGRRRRH